MTFVLDASVALTWYFADEQTPATEALLERTILEQVAVPAHWLGEVSNGVLVGERRKRSAIDHGAPFFRRLHTLLLDIDTVGVDTQHDIILPLARLHALTVYDALYLELAIRRALPLATLDDALAKAAQAVGVAVLGR